MTLPVGSAAISLSQVNAELGRSSSSPIKFSDTDLRTLAKAGNNAISNTVNSNSPQINVNSLHGTARAIVAINSNLQNDNMYNKIVATGRYATGKTWASYVVNTDIVVGSTSTLNPSLIVGNFTGTDIVEIVVNSNGYIIGCGGNGGNGGYDGAGAPGSPGGPAVYTRFATVINNFGAIYGGGGGGGGGEGDHYFYGCSKTQGVWGGGGGGGAGLNPGNGGSSGYPGQAGSTLVGGAGGGNYVGGGANSGRGGAGGNPGLPGTAGWLTNGNINGQPGGAAGPYINGISYVTFATPGLVAGNVL